MEFPSPGTRHWMILDRALRVARAQAQAEEGHGEGVGVRLVALAGSVEQRAGEQVWLEQRLTEVDIPESSAAAVEAAEAAKAFTSERHHFTVAVKAPPLITFLTAGISYPNPPSKPDRNPCIVATGPFCLLAQFSAVPPRDPTQFYFFNPPPVGHLVVVRRFFGGADSRIGADAEFVPDRGDDMPKLLSRNVESVRFLCDDDDRSYIIAELEVTPGTDSPHNAVLICYRSVLRAWSSNPIGVPLPLEVDGKHGKFIRGWAAHGAVSLDSTIFWFDLSWGLLSLDFSLPESEFRLKFFGLPADREMGLDEAMAAEDICGRRCITVSDNLVRYVEIIVNAGEAPMVSMWSRRRQAGVTEWEWELDFEESFNNIWQSESYSRTGLPRDTPRLGCVNPVDSNLVYFTLQQSMFAVHIPEHRVVHSALMERASPPLRPHISRDFLAWTLPSRRIVSGAEYIRNVTAHPDIEDNEEQLGEIELPH